MQQGNRLSAGVVVLVFVLAFLYLSGRLDGVLVNAGLNFQPCVQTVFASQVCGDRATAYCQTAERSGIATSRGCGAFVNVSSTRPAGSASTSTSSAGHSSIVDYVADPDCDAAPDGTGYDANDPALSCSSAR